MHKRVPLYINGEFFESKTEHWMDVTNPANGEKLSEVPFTTMDEMEMAVRAAKEAFQAYTCSTGTVRAAASRNAPPPQAGSTTGPDCRLPRSATMAATFAGV